MAQKIINVGTVADDGTGDPLRSAMIKVVNNFSEVYSSFAFNLASNNVTLANNLTVGTYNLNANGFTGNVNFDSTNSSAYYIGSATVVNSGGLRTTGIVNTTAIVSTNFVQNSTGVYTTGVVNAGSIAATGVVNTGALNVTGPAIISGNLTVTGNLTLAGTTTFVNSTVITTTDKNIVLSNGAASNLQADGSGLVIANYANLLFSQWGAWVSNVNFVPAANNLNLGNTTSSWNLYGNNLYATIVNAASLTVGTSTIANSSGLYATTVNAASLTVGTSTIANSLGLYATTVNAASATIGGDVTANSSGVYVANIYATTITANLTGTASNATNLNSQPGAFYTNATNINTGTLPYTQLGPNVVNTSAAFTIANVHTYSANLVTNSGLLANTINASAVTIGTNLTANATGLYTVGTVNAASHTIGTNLTTNTLGVYHTGVVNAATLSAGATSLINSTGLYVTTANAASINIGGTVYINSSSTTHSANLVLTTTSGLISNGTVGTNGQVLTSNGTTPYWGPVVINTSAQYTFSNTITFSNTATLLTIAANNSTGNTGQYLTSNGNGGIFWATPGVINVNTAYQYTWSNTQTFTSNVVHNANVIVSATFTVNGVVNTASANMSSQTLTPSTSITWDLSQGQISTITLTMNSTITAVNNMKIGTYILHVYQDSTGSRTLTWPSSIFKWTASVTPPLTSAAGSHDVYTFVSDGSKMYGSFIPDVR